MRGILKRDGWMDERRKGVKGVLFILCSKECGEGKF